MKNAFINSLNLYYVEDRLDSAIYVCYGYMIQSVLVEELDITLFKISTSMADINTVFSSQVKIDD